MAARLALRGGRVATASPPASCCAVSRTMSSPPCRARPISNGSNAPTPTSGARFSRESGARSRRKCRTEPVTATASSVSAARTGTTCWRNSLPAATVSESCSSRSGRRNQCRSWRRRAASKSAHNRDRHPQAIAPRRRGLYIAAMGNAGRSGPRSLLFGTMNLRNIAIIAHVDHGKTTLVDRLLQQSGAFRDNQRVAERALDSSDLERERGITILAKATSILWQGTRINIVDTPGHADFGGEVERILNMFDAALVLVDAAEGPLPQTKFVVSKALKMGLKPIVVINKVDRADALPQEGVNEVFDLFAALDANDDQLDFPILYGSAKEGWMAASPEGPKTLGMQLLFDLVLMHVAAPKVEDGPFRLLGTILEANPYLGRIVTGRITSGAIAPNEAVKVLDHTGALVEQGRVTKVLAFRGLERVGLDQATAGDIVSTAGLPNANVPHTICAPEVTAPLPAQPIDPPTLSMTFRVNDSPLAGTEGTKVTGRMIRDRLMREAEGNAALRVTEAEERDSMEVAGRGELQLGILIETMRREGFELSVSRPKVLFKREAGGALLEPVEEVVIDLDEEHSGVVVRKLSERKAEL